MSAPAVEKVKLPISGKMKTKPVCQQIGENIAQPSLTIMFLCILKLQYIKYVKILRKMCQNVCEAHGKKYLLTIIRHPPDTF